ncbi:hypothetical protein BDL97_06G091600 [Sphagnum fallax]|nr:hypothetical protein BDL97_06G091600 [Sphagnum fallax]KAH8959710.1 hypothetical protein BDL97_06G091600 [Sphagnum fallax]
MASDAPLVDAPELLSELRRTFQSGRTKSQEWRLEQLHALLKMVMEQEDEIAKALSLDLGKSAYETYSCELALLIDSCKLAIKSLKKWMTPEQVSIALATVPSTAVIRPEPFGVALIISAWNFPIILALDPLVGAIAAGCAVVIKPSEIAPATSAFLAKMIPVYMDKEAIRVVEGGVQQITALLDQKWDKIFFTGNAKVGRIIMAAAAKHLTPVTLELGGKCPLYIDSTVDLKVAAKRIVIGKWGSSCGQACISPNHLLVEESFVPKLISTLKNTIVDFYGEDPRTSKDLAHVVNKNHFKRLTALLDDPSTADKIIHGGERDEESLYIAPTLLLDVPLDAPIMNEEIFGPILPIITVKGPEEAIDMIADQPKPLAIYVFTNDKVVQDQMVSKTSSGGMVINDAVLHFVCTSLPFGGVGESGMGAYHGKASFDAFSHRKSILYRGMSVEVYARYPPYTTKKQQIIRALLSRDFVGLLLVLLGLRK